MLTYCSRFKSFSSGESSSSGLDKEEEEDEEEDDSNTSSDNSDDDGSGDGASPQAVSNTSKTATTGTRSFFSITESSILQNILYNKCSIFPKRLQLSGGKIKKGPIKSVLLAEKEGLEPSRRF